MTSDTLCQLCKAEPGTLAHRRVCPATVPSGGWPTHPTEANEYISSMHTRRRSFALDRGLMLASLVVRPAPVEASFRWLPEPPDGIDDSATWYIDGSLIHGRFKPAARTGFGIVVVSRNGDLLAFGYGVPPSWITDASGAEAWAFYVVVSSTVSCPRTVTDCYNIIIMLQAGRVAATLPSRPLARIWNIICSSVDCDAMHALANSRVHWMPAHCSVAAIGTRIKSNGDYVSAIDWRANRLVDALAKLAANSVAVPDLALQLFDSAHVAAEYHAALAGVVTFEANHHRIEVVRRDGSVGSSVVRDSQPGPKPKDKRPRSTGIPHMRAPLSSAAAPVVSAQTPAQEECFEYSREVCPDSATVGKRRRTTLKDIEGGQNALFHAHWRASRDLEGQPAPPPISAADRFQAIRERVLAKKENCSREQQGSSA